MRAYRPVPHGTAAPGFLSFRHNGILGPMTTQDTALHECACGCGEPVSPGATWKRGHFHRGVGGGANLRPLPGPEDDIDLEEEFDLGEPPELPGQPPWDGNGGGPDWTDEIPPDEPPADLGQPKSGPRKRGQPKVTTGIRKDINAKISLGLELPGRIWQARDPWCGGAFIHQRPAIADALTDIVCDSADLVEWFTGPASGFMKYLKLAAALQPVAVVVYGHHVAHTIGEDEQGQPQERDMSRYAA